MAMKTVITAHGRLLGTATGTTHSMKLGTLVQTQVCDKWMSKQYWDCTENEWVELEVGTVAMIVDVNAMNIKFLARDRLFSIHNCYHNPETDMPVWCSAL